MLATIRKILAYLDWLMLISFIMVFGIYLIPKTIVGGIIAFVCAIGLLLIMFEESSNRYSSNRRISFGNPLGNPLVDIALGIFAYHNLAQTDNYYYLFLIGIIMVGIDFLLWSIKCIEQIHTKNGRF